MTKDQIQKEINVLKRKIIVQDDEISDLEKQIRKAEESGNAFDILLSSLNKYMEQCFSNKLKATKQLSQGNKMGNLFISELNKLFSGSDANLAFDSISKSKSQANRCITNYQNEIRQCKNNIKSYKLKIKMYQSQLDSMNEG